MRFISKLKVAFGNPKVSEKANVNNDTSAIINDIEHQPFAISDQNVLYAGLNELGGYYFFQTVIVGTFHIKTKKGTKLRVVGHDFEMNLNSDMLELESDHSGVSSRYITKIDFQIEETDAAKLAKSQLSHLVLSGKKQAEVTFKMYTCEEEE